METKQIEEERDNIKRMLSERLEKHDESRKAAQKNLHEICEGLKGQIKELEGKVAKELEEKFTAEDRRLQSAYENLQKDGGEDISKMIQKAKAELLVMQSYELVDHSLGEDMDEDEDEENEEESDEDMDEDEDEENEEDEDDEGDESDESDEEPMRKKLKSEGGENEEPFDLSSLCELKTERRAVPEMVELMKPTNVRVSGTNKGAITFQFTCLSPDEMKVLSENGYESQIEYKCLLTKRGEDEGKEYALKSAGGDRFKLTSRKLAKKSTYGVRVKMILEDKESEWSDEVTIPGGTKTEAQKPSVSGLNPEKLEEERENIKKLLSKRLEIHDESRKAAQEKLHEICEELRAQVDKLGEKINSELEEKFTAEDNRLQTALDELRSSEDSKMIQKAKAGLLVEQTYNVVERDSDDYNEDEQESIISSLYELKTERNVVYLKLIEFEGRKPANLVPSFTEKGELALSFTFFSEDEVEALKDVDSPFEAEVKVWEKGHEEGTSKTLGKKMILGSDEAVCIRNTFTASTSYCLKVRIAHKEVSTQWSDEAEFTTPEFKGLCIWKECPDNVEKDMKYSVDEKNPRIATNIGGDWCTIIGNTPLPLNKVTSWSIKILKSKKNDCVNIYVGIAPSDINQNGYENSEKCGWYLYCYDSSLNSGLPHRYRRKEYGPRKEWEENGQYVHNEDSVGVMMNTAKGELSFVVNGVNLGVAYEGIPLDKPLVPCVILGVKCDSVELDTSEAKENVDSSIPVPSNIRTNNGTTWDSITLAWDAVDGASFYQIEVDGSKFWDVSTTNTFTKRGFPPETEHTFRVRAVKGNSVSEWTNTVKAKTQKTEMFSKCAWKECPEDVDENKKYSVDEKNPRIATKIGNYWCTVIGNTPLPHNKVTSWSIKILKSKKNNGDNVYIGVAPSDIDQNEMCNFNKCGWYFDCVTSALNSGAPHYYCGKPYGPMKGKGWGDYVHNGDSVGIVMDTAKGELTFVLKKKKLGVAYAGIPLDKPLVPCVVLGNEGESLELVI